MRCESVYSTQIMRSSSQPTLFVFSVLVLVAQDGTAYNDRIRTIGSNGDGRVLLAGYTEGNWTGGTAGTYDFAAVLIELYTPDTPPPSLPPTAPPTPSPTPSPTTERPMVSPPSTTAVPMTTFSPHPISTPAPSSSPQTIPPSTEAPGPSSTGSSSTSTATIAGTVAAAVFVVILSFAVLIRRRNTKRQGEGVQLPRSTQRHGEGVQLPRSAQRQGEGVQLPFSTQSQGESVQFPCSAQRQGEGVQFPRSTQNTQNAPNPVAHRPRGHAVSGRGSVNAVHNDVPPPDYSTIMSDGALPR